LKAFEELLLDNMLFKVQNHTLETKNPKWKEWWQTVQEFIEEQIFKIMELVYYDEHSYQLELQAHQTAFLDFNMNILVSYMWKLEPIAKHYQHQLLCNLLLLLN
jgi:hypothetical protein